MFDCQIFDRNEVIVKNIEYKFVGQAYKREWDISDRGIIIYIALLCL